MTLSNNLPLKKGSTEIDTRPLYIEEWLETLPYIDFKQTSELLHQALQASNKQTVKSSVRMKLVELYNRPYQYYVESQIKTGAQHTLQTIDAMQAQIKKMKRIAVDLSFSCKLAVEETLKKKTLWKTSKPPLESMLMSLNYLSHALIFSYLEYSPTPKRVWQELNFIYEFAEGLNSTKKILEIPGPNNINTRTTIEHAYKKIIMASLVDPHHLPFGAIWEIYEQLNSWAEYTQIHEIQQEINPAGYFVINLASDSRPIPLSKFNLGKATEKYRLLDSTPLENLIQKHIDLLNMGQQLDSSICLSPFYARSILAHMLKSWGLPPKRYFPRKSQKGSIELASSFKSVYYFFNDNKEFAHAQPSVPANEDVMIEEEGDLNTTTDEQFSFSSEVWHIVDHGPGGTALIKKEKPKNPVRVGELVCTKSSDNMAWILGTVRWMMVSNNVYKIGIQNLAKHVQPVAIRACKGSKADSEFRRAFIVSSDKTLDETTIITDKGLFTSDREMEININNKQQKILADTLLESTVAFEQFSYKPA